MFIFGRSLNSVTVETFLSFIDVNQDRDIRFIRNKFKLININWTIIINNSINVHGIKENREAYTEFKKPILQVCIDNESELSFTA